MRGRLTLQIASPKGPLVSTPSPRVNERGRNAACREWMSITHLRKWDVSGIEIALDLEIPRISDRSRFVFSGPAEPRIRLVVCFALTSQLKRIVTAVDRAAPARPPSGLRISSTERRSMPPPVATMSIQPTVALVRLQSRLIRAIEPGLAHDALSSRVRRTMEESTIRFVSDFIPHKALPTLEPACPVSDFDATDVSALGLTIYRLGEKAAPKSILAHWAFPPDIGRVRPRARSAIAQS